LLGWEKDSYKWTVSSPLDSISGSSSSVCLVSFRNEDNVYLCFDPKGQLSVTDNENFFEMDQKEWPRNKFITFRLHLQNTKWEVQLCYTRVFFVPPPPPSRDSFQITPFDYEPKNQGLNSSFPPSYDKSSEFKSYEKTTFDSEKMRNLEKTSKEWEMQAKQLDQKNKDLEFKLLQAENKHKKDMENQYLTLQNKYNEQQSQFDREYQTLQKSKNELEKTKTELEKAKNEIEKAFKSVNDKLLLIEKQKKRRRRKKKKNQNHSSCFR